MIMTCAMRQPFPNPLCPAMLTILALPTSSNLLRLSLPSRRHNCRDQRLHISRSVRTPHREGLLVAAYLQQYQANHVYVTLGRTKFLNYSTNTEAVQKSGAHEDSFALFNFIYT